jgi:myosin-5
MSAGGNLNMCACENGEAFAWPYMKNEIMISVPVKMPFSPKIKIIKTSCGHNFGFFISSQGLVYAIGRDNSEGQLGLGHTYPREVPELLSSLKDIGERIETIECGYRHVLALSSLGKLYTWGWGARGQLGLGHQDSEMSPRFLQIEKSGHKERIV